MLAEEPRAEAQTTASVQPTTVAAVATMNGYEKPYESNGYGNGGNGYGNGGFDEKQPIDEDAFGAKAGNIVSAFDAFRESLASSF